MEASNDTPNPMMEEILKETPMEIPPQTEEVVTSKKGKRESQVWEYYAKLPNGRVSCKYCNRDYAYSSVHVTTTLWKHLKEKCVKSPLFKKCLAQKQQKMLMFKEVDDVKVGGKKRELVSHAFDAEKCRTLLIRMIVKDELTFRIVGGE